MIGPVILVAVAPFVFGLAIGPKILAGILMGIIVSGLQFASSATTSGDAWSAARKHI
jgi:Na+/H+-translocating membrane pyrophosphatase